MVIYSLRTEDLNEVLDFHRQIMDEISDLYNKDIVQYYNHYLKQYPFEAIYQHYSEFIEAINSDINNGMMKILENWASSEDSFVGLAKSYKAGSGAETEAKYYQRRILEITKDYTRAKTKLIRSHTHSAYFDEVEFEAFIAELSNKLTSRKENITKIWNRLTNTSDKNVALTYFSEIEEEVIEFTVEGMKRFLDISKNDIINNFNQVNKKKQKRKASFKGTMKKSFNSLNEDTIINHKSKIKDLFNL